MTAISILTIGLFLQPSIIGDYPRHHDGCFKNVLGDLFRMTIMAPQSVMRVMARRSSGKPRLTWLSSRNGSRGGAGTEAAMGRGLMTTEGRKCEQNGS
jgi:hypothetical protein